MIGRPCYLASFLGPTYCIINCTNMRHLHPCALLWALKENHINGAAACPPCSTDLRMVCWFLGVSWSLFLKRLRRPYVQRLAGLQAVDQLTGGWGRKVRPSAISWLLYAIKSQPSINLTVVLASCRYKWFLLQRDGPFIRCWDPLFMPPFFQSFIHSFDLCWVLVSMVSLC